MPATTSGPPTDGTGAPLGPVEALERVVYLLDRSLAPAPKIRAFRRAAAVAREVGPAELSRLVDTGRVRDLPGIGASTGAVITAAVRGEPSPYLARLEADTAIVPTEQAAPYRAALVGDCHLHSDWSDGGAPIATMARTARALGHAYLVLTDHSPRLTVAHGLDRERLLAQLEEIAALNEELDRFRILTGMEVDILADGSLDLDDDLLDRLDIVVASVHSKLRMPRQEMTRRLVRAVASPHVDILGHCTGRKLADDGEQPASDAAPRRPPSDFDAEVVFTACAQLGTAVEVNCRPERQDPPEELLRLAVELGCLVAIDTDAHAPGQLEWQPYGCDKVARVGVPAEIIVNTWSAERLVAWATGAGAG